jgi:hypothetical protein
VYSEYSRKENIIEYIVSKICIVMQSQPKNTLVLSAESLCGLPLDILIHIANMNVEAYMRMYLLDTGFRKYAKGVYAVDDFIERFVVERVDGCIIYTLGNIKYYIYDDGDQIWFMDDLLHRIDGPAIICANGKQCWYINGIFHRVDGPAQIYPNGDMFWYINGNYHRDDGPAVVYASGYRGYYQHGKLHRVDGPAVIYPWGGGEYWEMGVKVR